MEISPYEGTIDVPIGDGGLVTLRTSIPGAERERAEALRVKMVSSAKPRQDGRKITAEDLSVTTEMDEAAYRMALAVAYVVRWNFTRHGMLIPLEPVEVKQQSIAGLPDQVYKPLIDAVLKQAEGRTEEEQSAFRGGSAALGA